MSLSGWTRGHLAQVEIAQQGDLGAVMDDLTVDVENQRGEGTIRKRALAAADGPGEFADAQTGDTVASTSW